MTFKFDGNVFAQAIQTVLKEYNGHSNNWVVAAQTVEDTDKDESIRGILQDNGYEAYRQNCLNDIVYVVYTVRGIEVPAQLKTRIPAAQLDRAATMLKEE